MARNSLKNVCRLIDSVTASLPAEQEFLADLKRSIEMSDKKTSKPPSKTYKPSSMNCVRNMYYQVTGAEQDDTSSSYQLVGICNSGTDVHVRIQTAVAQMMDNGIDCEYVNVSDFIKNRALKDIQVISQSGMETKLFHTKLNMSFMCDGIISYKGQFYVLELKTESSFKWQNRTGVDPSHYNQGTAYCLSFELSRVIFVYINRDTFDMKAFMFTVTDEMKADLVGLIDESDYYVSMGRPPQKPEGVARKTCEYCSYKKTCKKDGDSGGANCQSIEESSLNK